MFDFSFYQACMGGLGGGGGGGETQLVHKNPLYESHQIFFAPK
jgi:hypothetical protein